MLALKKAKGKVKGRAGEIRKFWNFSRPVFIRSFQILIVLFRCAYLRPAFPTSQKATALAAATFSESTPRAMGIITV